MRKITVTEQNFRKVLKKLQRICNSHKMFEFYRVYSENMVEEKQYRNSAIGFRRKAQGYIDKNGEYNVNHVNEFYAYSNYIGVEVHRYRKAYESDPKSYDSETYIELRKPLIYLDLLASRALVISDGDKIQFLPFGGFVIWTDDDFTRFNKPLTIYKHAYFPDFFKGKIKDLEKEKSIREQEWEEDAAWWDEQYEIEMQRELDEDDFYNDLSY